MNTRTTHNAGSTGQQIVERKFNYDHAGRLMKTWHKLNAQDWVLLTMNEYNELGQLVTKKLHNTDAEQASDESRQFKQNVDYRYNIRGWLESVNDLAESEGDLFGMNLHYNDPTANGGTPLYNGNISEIQWKGPDAKTNSYGYNYDAMNRLTEANFYNATNGNRFNEHIKSPDNTSGYDLNGNILFLQRNGKTGIDGVGVTTFGTMDDLRYEYRGNQLLKVTDDAIDTEGFIDGSNTDNDYDYDKNGNMLIDKNKSIDDATTGTGKSVISYNYLNLPEKVVKSNGEYLKYIYDATGRKLSQEVYNASNELQKKSDYAGEFFYEDNTLKFVNHEEGRVVMSGSQGEYQYHLKDHLGNVRLTFTTNEELETVTATLEDAKATTEQSQFLNYAEVRKIDNKVFDHTNEGGTYNSTRLMGGNTTEVYGLAKTLSVMPGDVIRMEVYAKYLDPETNNWSGALQNVISSIAGIGNAGGTYVDGGQLGTIDGVFPHPGLLVRENDEGAGPKAYLNYLVFDRDFKYLTGGFKRVSTAAGESGTTLSTNNAEGINHEHLHFDDGIVINEAGYVYIYLSNENETPVEVFFDDFMVEHLKSPVVQMDDYYPFGLTFNSYSRENSTPNQYKFNGKEEQDELGLGWLDYGARMYDASLGRWNKIDRLSEKFTPLSPYTYAACNPIIYIDINGDDIYYFDENGYYTGYMVKDGGPNRGMYHGEEFFFGDQEHDHLNLVLYKEEDEKKYEKTTWFKVEGENGLDIDRRIDEAGAYDVNNKWDGLKKILEKKGTGIQDMGVGMENDDAKFGTHTIISTAKGKVSFSSRNYGNFLLAIAFAVMTDGMIDGEDAKILADLWEKRYGEDWADSRDDQKAIELGGQYYKDHFSDNSGTNNKRSSDKNYSDDFLKWYYDDDDDDDKK